MPIGAANEKRQSGTLGEPALVTYAQDFESTIQEYISDQSQLVGILNFSALWHEVVYLNDIAIGDNPHLIKSFLDPAQPQLYVAVVEFIRAGILRCHLRDKVAIKGKVLVESEPSLSQIFKGWWDDGPQERFTTQVFGDDRDRYNRTVDDWFTRFPKAIVRYDPDTVKPAFRCQVRKLVNNPNSDLRSLLGKLPKEIEREYLTICERNEYFTNADLWRLVKRTPGSRELVVAHGHINQQCCGDLVHAGMSGADLSPIELQRFNWNVHVGSRFSVPIEPPKTFDEVLERADVVMAAPTLEVLGLLTPKQVMQLREKADSTIFRVAREAPQLLGIDKIPGNECADLPTVMGYLQIDLFRRKYVAALQDYWQHVCDFLEREYPEQTTAKGRLGMIAYEALSEVPQPLRIGTIGITLFTGLNWLVPGDAGSLLWKTLSAAGSASILNFCLGKLAYRLLLERTPAMMELRRVDPLLTWRPNGVYATNRWK